MPILYYKSRLDLFKTFDLKTMITEKCLVFAFIGWSIWNQHIRKKKRCTMWCTVLCLRQVYTEPRHLRNTYHPKPIVHNQTFQPIGLSGYLMFSATVCLMFICMYFIWYTLPTTEVKSDIPSETVKSKSEWASGGFGCFPIQFTFNEKFSHQAPW